MRALVSHSTPTGANNGSNQQQQQPAISWRSEDGSAEGQLSLEGETRLAIAGPGSSSTKSSDGAEPDEDDDLINAVAEHAQVRHCL